MSIADKIKNIIRAYIVKRASSNKMIDIVEVRTREIGLISVTTETDIRIRNSFILPVTILSIKTDLVNRDGIKVGRMSYEFPKKIKGKSDEVLTTVSEISIITSIFQAISTLLLQHISMRSIGIARIKFLWWIFEIPVDDYFDIHPNKLKIIKDETPEEQQERKLREVARKQQREIEKLKRKTERTLLKEEILKKRYKENYIPKQERENKRAELIIANEEIQPAVVTAETGEIEFSLDEAAVQQMADETNEVTMPTKEETKD